MIWNYDETVSTPHEDDLASETCVFCHGSMRVLMESMGPRAGGSRVRACEGCGWWTYWQQTRSITFDPDTGRHRWSLYGAAAQLRRLDEIDVSQGLDEVTRYLLAKPGSRFDLHPRVFEETVASVFRDMGFQADVTAYTADGGIDVILRTADGRTTGVQVKRVRAAIEVHEIRALAGALLLGGHTRGVYVTTSRFRSGAVAAARRLSELSMPVELIDAERFFDAMRISRRPAYQDYSEWAKVFGDPPDLATVYENEMEGG